MKKLIALLLALALSLTVFAAFAEEDVSPISVPRPVRPPCTAWRPSTAPRSPWMRSTPPAENTGSS